MELFQSLIQSNFQVKNEFMFPYGEDEISTAQRHGDSKVESAVHSGHFMISSLDENDEDADDELSDSSDSKKGFDFSTARKETTPTYNFKPVAIMPSSGLDIDFDLSKLFQRMSLAYSGKLTSPKWKNFKGLKISVKDKVRLNNVIWREWHLQYINGRRPTNRYCQFEPPIPDKAHTKPEAVVMEGKYWKRKLESVCSEYRKWRRYFRDRHRIAKPDELYVEKENEDSDMFDDDLLQSLFRFTGNNDNTQRAGSPGAVSLFGDGVDLPIELSDQVLNSLAIQFLGFPNPREMSQLGNADIIQPGLVQLQPSIDEDIQLPPISPLPSLQDMISVNSSKPYSNYSLSSLQQSPMDVTGGMTAPYASRTPKPNYASKAKSKIKKVTFRDAFVKPSPPNLADMLKSTSPVPIEPQQDDIRGYSKLARTLSGSPSAPSTFMSMAKPQVANVQMEKTSSNSSQLMSLLRGMNEPTPDLQQRQRARAASAPQVSCTPALFTTQESVFSGFNRGKSSTSVEAFGTPSQLKSTFFQSPVENLSKKATVQTAQPEFVAPSEPFKKPLSSFASGVSIKMENSIPEQPVSFLAQLLQKPNDAPSTLTKSPAIQQTAGVSSQPTDAVWPPYVTFITPNAPVRGTAVKPSTDPASIFTANDSPTSDPSTVRFMPTSVPSSPAGSDTEHRSRHTSGGDIEFFVPKKMMKEETPPAPSTGPRRRNILDPVAYKEHRRSTHISSEQKRRCSIKSGFDSLANLVPSLNQNPNLKVPKATILFKAVDYCHALKRERQLKQEEMQTILAQIKEANATIASLQAELPVTGAPTVGCPKNNQLRETFKEYVYRRTFETWKFWIFSLLLEPLFDSFNSSVSTHSVQELQNSTLRWLEQHCGLAKLREETCNRMVVLNSRTNMVRDPSSLPKYIAEAIEQLKPKPK